MKRFIRKEKLLIDIVLFGSILKGKERPNDIDLIAIARERDYEKLEDILYRIKKIGREEGLNIHIEPLIVDDMHTQKVYLSLIHEGFSIVHEKSFSALLGFSAVMIIQYSLAEKSNSEKVRFSYALYGRNKGEGLLKSIRGIELGKGAILVPVQNHEEIKNFFKQWDVHFKEQRAALFS